MVNPASLLISSVTPDAPVWMEQFVDKAKWKRYFEFVSVNDDDQKRIESSTQDPYHKAISYLV